jgi:hypothetical protein
MLIMPFGSLAEIRLDSPVASLDDGMGMLSGETK